MLNGLRVIFRGLRHLNLRGYTYVWANVAAVVLCLPIVTIPAAWGGLCKLSYHALRRPNAEWDDFTSGVKEQLGRGILIGLINALVLIINGVNLYNSLGDDSLMTNFLRGVWLFVLFAWFSIQLYFYPLWYAMENPTVTGAIRNAALMVAQNPLFTLTIWLSFLLLWLVSTIFFALWLLLTLSVMAVIANTAVQDRLRAAGIEKPSASPPVDASTPVDEIL